MGALLNPMLEWAAAETARLRRGLSRSALDAAVALFAGLAALEGLMILLVGGYSSLIETVEPWLAGLIVGGVMILVAVAVLAMVARRKHRSRIPEPPLMAQRRFVEERPAADSPGLLKAAAAEMIDRADIKVRDVALVALVAGLALGVSPHLRRHLFRRRSGQ